MRFLRARDMDVEAAAVMLRECLEWRHSQGLLGGSGDPTAVLSVDDLALETSLRPLLLYDIGRDQRGRPMLIELVGRWDCERIVEFIESGGSGTARGLSIPRLRKTMARSCCVSSGAVLNRCLPKLSGPRHTG